MSYGDNGSGTSKRVSSPSGDCSSSRSSDSLGSSLSSKSPGGVTFSRFDRQSYTFNSGYQSYGFGAAQNAFSAQQDNSAGTKFKPGVGVVGGEPYPSPAPTSDNGSMNGVQESDSQVIAQHLSAIVAANKFNVDIGNYFDNAAPSSGFGTEAAGVSLLGRAWNAVNTATHWTDKNIVTPGHNVYQHWIQEPIHCAVNAFHNSVVPSACQAFGKKKQEGNLLSGFLTKTQPLISLQQNEKNWSQLDKSGRKEDKIINQK